MFGAIPKAMSSGGQVRAMTIEKDSPVWIIGQYQPRFRNNAFDIKLNSQFYMSHFPVS